MQNTIDRFFVITGGPGAGKSTLIAALAQAGCNVAQEAGRSIIQEQVAVGGRALPWADRSQFAWLMMERDIAAFEAMRQKSGTAYFDRGIPDVIGYLTLCELPVPAALQQAAERCRYNRRVFIMPPWPEIFAPDAERKQTQDEAEATYRAMVATYTACGYDLIDVPRTTVAERARFVCARSPV
ncbi:MAG: AAA family ATPase [Proteobacteria bacterium]|nr:AAA family ATPase [Pseudomonadota bacterium]